MLEKREKRGTRRRGEGPGAGAKISRRERLSLDLGEQFRQRGLDSRGPFLLPTSRFKLQLISPLSAYSLSNLPATFPLQTLACNSSTNRLLRGAPRLRLVAMLNLDLGSLRPWLQRHLEPM